MLDADSKEYYIYIVEINPKRVNAKQNQCKRMVTKYFRSADSKKQFSSLWPIEAILITQNVHNLQHHLAISDISAFTVTFVPTNLQRNRNGLVMKVVGYKINHFLYQRGCLWMNFIEYQENQKQNALKCNLANE